MDKQHQDADTYGEQEAVRRRDDAVRRALNTPPQPKKNEKSDREPAKRTPRR